MQLAALGPRYSLEAKQNLYEIHKYPYFDQSWKQMYLGACAKMHSQHIGTGDTR